jgi:hypothetical protein
VTNYATNLIVFSVLLALIVADVAARQFGLSAELFWAYMSTAITISGYTIYVCQMFPKAVEQVVKPEPLSWALFGFLTATGALVQITQGGSVGSWCLIVTAFACFLIAGLSYWKWRMEWKFDRFHKITAAGALALFVFGALTSRWAALATVSAVLATLADMISYGPMLRKAWSKPYQESVTNLAFNSVKCVPALLALESYSLATTVYLGMLTIVNGGFAIFLLIRRRHVGAAEFK